MRLYIKQIFLLLFIPSLYAQVQEEVQEPYNIKSIVFKGPTDDQFPIITIDESFTLEFDDILGNEQNYFYRIVHCDYNWQRSQLLKSQYLNGIDNQLILDTDNSFSTLQSYSNYRLQIPNEDVSLKVSGNYILEIYNNADELQFSRRFILYKNAIGVGALTRRSRDFEYIKEKQVVQFTINGGEFPLVNPKKEVKVVILQNYHWPTAITNIKPQFTIGRQLVYKYNTETSFFGGNEYLNFDTSDLRVSTAAISHIELEDLYHHYLFKNQYRYNQPYTFFPDINGDFSIRTLQGDDFSREAEYTNVHFELPYNDILGLDEVHVFGKFNNYAINEENKMTYNEDTKTLELSLKLKQGFYNYKYVIKREDDIIDLNMVSGNQHFTENNYLILVYYRIFGDMFDTIIGIGSTNSRNITN